MLNSNFKTLQFKREFRDLQAAMNLIMCSDYNGFKSNAAFFINTVNENPIIKDIIIQYKSINLNYNEIFIQRTAMLASRNIILPTTKNERIAFALKIIYDEDDLYSSILNFLIFSHNYKNYNQSYTWIVTNIFNYAFESLILKIQYYIEDYGNSEYIDNNAFNSYILNITVNAEHGSAIAIGNHNVQTINYNSDSIFSDLISQLKSAGLNNDEISNIKQDLQKLSQSIANKNDNESAPILKKILSFIKDSGKDVAKQALVDSVIKYAPQLISLIL